MIQQQSIQAFELIKPELGKRQAQILNVIFQLGSASNHQISEFLNLEINQITGRTNELSKKNRIYEVKKGYDGHSKVKVTFWGIRGGYK